MTGKGFLIIAGSVAAGAVAATLYLKNKEKARPMAAELVAKGLRLKDKAAEYASRTKEQAEEIMAEAKRINEAAAAKEA